MEPSHQAIWNLSDMFSLLRDDVDGLYHLYTADDIRADSNLLALASGAHIDPFDIDYAIGYMNPPSQPVMAANTDSNLLPQGRYIRLITLVEKPSNNYLRMAWTDIVDPGGSHFDTPFDGVVNQEIAGVWQPTTPLITFREVKAHFYSGILSCKPLTQDPITGVYYCPYPEEDAQPLTDLTPFPVTILFPGGGLMQQQSPVYSQSPSYSKSQAVSPSGASGVMILFRKGTAPPRRR
jgi:hypothetical protein